MSARPICIVFHCPQDAQLGKCYDLIWLPHSNTTTNVDADSYPESLHNFISCSLYHFWILLKLWSKSANRIFSDVLNILTTVDKTEPPFTEVISIWFISHYHDMFILIQSYVGQDGRLATLFDVLVVPTYETTFRGPWNSPKSDERTFD